MYKKRVYLIYIMQKRLIMLDATKKRSICFQFKSDLEELDLSKSKAVTDEKNK